MAGLDHTPWYRSQKQASKQICQPAFSCWGKSRSCNLVYYLGLDTHLVALAGKRGVLYDGGGRERKGLAFDSGAREGGARLRGVPSLGGEGDLEC